MHSYLAVAVSSFDLSGFSSFMQMSTIFELFGHKVVLAKSSYLRSSVESRQPLWADAKLPFSFVSLASFLKTFDNALSPTIAASGALTVTAVEKR
jgi:hypothetical protein